MKSILFSVHSIFFVRCTKTGGELGFSPTLPGQKIFTAKADSPLERDRVGASRRHGKSAAGTLTDSACVSAQRGAMWISQFRALGHLCFVSAFKATRAICPENLSCRHLPVGHVTSTIFLKAKIYDDRNS
jgi:hypothetical protein